MYIKSLQHNFVEFMPQALEEGILYISIKYGVVIHKCPCGCGNKIVTPLAPSEWKLTYDGETVSLDPSVGNWSLPCKSHYWVKNSEIILAITFSKVSIRPSTS